MQFTPSYRCIRSYRCGIRAALLITAASSLAPATVVAAGLPGVARRAPAPDLELKKTVVSVAPDGTITFAINIKNIGNATATGPTTLTETLSPGYPAGTTFTGTSGAGALACPSFPAASPMTCTLAANGGSLGAGQGWAGWTIKVKVPPSGGTVTNCAKITMPSQVVDANPANNQSCVTVTVPGSGGPDLQLKKTVVSVSATGIVTYAINVKNIGNATASGPMTVTEALTPGFPAGSVFSGISGAGTLSCPSFPAASPITCTLPANGGSLGAGQAWSGWTISVKVPPAGGSLENCATVSVGVGTAADVNLGNNKDCVKVMVPASGFSCPTTPAGVVTQVATAASPGKCWMPVGTSTKTYAQVNSYCSSLGAGWRMATKTELLSLYASGLMNNPNWTGLNLDWIVSSDAGAPGTHVAVNIHPPGGTTTPAVDTTPFAYTCVHTI
ncbi:MAG: hypothetical protein JWO05_2811 [Gemmatimonadetes bacterium]|nr:hypothetical protein [Gemmatimonadota bacterium]